MALEEGRFFRGNMTDKRHDADGLAEYCRRFLSSGVWELGGNLKVTVGDGLKVGVDFGVALVDGFPYRLWDNGTGRLLLSLKSADGQPRIDRIVVRKDSAELRVFTYIKQGEPAEFPVPPLLLRTKGIYEISLAQAYVTADATEVTDITDERNDDEVCGIVQSRLLPPMEEYLRIADLLTAILSIDGSGSGVDADTLDGYHASNFAAANRGLPAGGTVRQNLRKTSAEDYAAEWADLYPLGAVYISVSSVSPATLFGGTWAAFSAGRVLVGYNSNDAAFNTVEKTGGAKTVALTTANMPSDFPTLKMASSSNSGSYSTQQLAVGKETGTIYENMNPLKEIGSGTAHNNLQPYITVHMWKRTA